MKLEKEQAKEKNTLKEVSSQYEITNNYNIHHKHDKTYRKCLGSKRNVAYIINKALKPKKQIKEEELEKYSNRYITEQLLDKETDIVYKLKQKEIYFLIEHQSKIDYSMPYRIEEYKIEIMKSAIDLRKVKTKNYKIPVVIPIVIYTGKEKWKVGLELNNIYDRRLEHINMLQYNLIDINNYTKEDLLESKNFMDKIFLIEKTEDTKELTKIMQKVVKQVKTEEDKNNLKMLIKKALKPKMQQEEIENLINEIEGGKRNMFAVEEMVIKENIRLREEGIKEGRKRTIIQIAKEMKKNNIAIELIEKITGLTRKEIE